MRREEMGLIQVENVNHFMANVCQWIRFVYSFAIKVDVLVRGWWYAYRVTSAPPPRGR